MCVTVSKSAYPLSRVPSGLRMRPLVCLLSLTMGCQAYLAHPPSVYVCHTYPFCEMDLKTRTWSSSLTDGQGATTGRPGNLAILYWTQEFPFVRLFVVLSVLEAHTTSLGFWSGVELTLLVRDFVLQNAKFTELKLFVGGEIEKGKTGKKCLFLLYWCSIFYLKCL